MDEVTRQPDGKWITAPKSPAPFTHANARSMAERRWARYRRAAVERIVSKASAIDPTVQTPADAYGLVAAKQYTALMDSAKPRIADLEKLGQIMTGQSVENSHRANEQMPPNSISVTPSTLLELASRLEREITARVDKARAVDVESSE